MIEVTRLNGTKFYINAEHIQMVEAAPDTHILLTNGQAYVVRESAELVAELVVIYRQSTNGVLPHQRVALRPTGS